MTYNVLPNQRVPFAVPPTRLDWLFVATAAEKLYQGDLAGGSQLLRAISPGRVVGFPTRMGVFPTMAAAVLDIGYNLVAFAGTQNVPQVIGDVFGSAPTINWYGSGVVNQYFNTAASAQIYRLLDVIDLGIPTVLMGHSLGGAIAQLVAVLLQHFGGTVAGVYTVGSPKVGSRTYAQNLTFPLYQLRAIDDPIPSLPPGTISPLPISPGRFLKWLKLIESSVGIGLYEQAGVPTPLDPSGQFLNLVADMGLWDLVKSFGSGSWRAHLSAAYQTRLRLGLRAADWQYAFSGGYERPWLILDMIDFNLQYPDQATTFITVPDSWSNKFQTGVYPSDGRLFYNAILPDLPPASIDGSLVVIPPPPVCGAAC